MEDPEEREETPIDPERVEIDDFDAENEPAEDWEP